jgi:nicotinate-nucleotide pyrophosphorylase (carboxylating)
LPTPPTDVERIAAVALAEDGDSDLTTELTVPATLSAEAAIEYRNGGVLAGTAYAEAVLRASGCSVAWQLGEGSQGSAGSIVGLVQGNLRHILRAERPLLNILQRASGIATATQAFVRAVQGTGCRILHTRKTAPGLRGLDVAGVLAGGGATHRLDLGHEIMVKDNHWAALARGDSGIERAFEEARRRGLTALYVEVESLEQLEAACSAGATRLLIDNQTPATLRRWASLARQRSAAIEIEATGGITRETVRTYAEAGADFVSVGALTHSVRAADIALEVDFDRIGRR